MDQPESSEDGLQPQDLSSSATCALPIVFDLSRKADDCLLKANAVDTLHVVQPPGWFVGTAAPGGGGGGTSDGVTLTENPCDLSPVPCDQIQPDNAFSNTTVTLSYVSRSHVFPSSTTTLAPHCSLLDVSSLSKKLSQHASGYEALPLPLPLVSETDATATATATAQLCVGVDPHCLQPVSAPIEVGMGVSMSPDSFDFMLPAQVVQNVATGVCFLKHATTVDLHGLQDAAAGSGGGGDAGGAGAAVEILTPLQQGGGPIVCKISPPQENGCLANGDCGALWGPAGACGVGIGVGVGIEAVGVGIDGVGGLGVDDSGLTSGGLFASTAEVVQGVVDQDPDLLFLISRTDQPLLAAHDIRTSRSICSVLEREYVSPLEDPVSPTATLQDEIEDVFVLPQTAGSPTGDRFPDDGEDLMAARDADLGFCDASSPAMLACNSDQECLSVDSNTELISATELDCQTLAAVEVGTTHEAPSEQCQEENQSEKAHKASGNTKSHELTTTNTHQVNGDAPAKNRVPERKILPPRTGRGIRLEAIVQNINPYRWRVSTAKTKSTLKSQCSKEKAPENKDAKVADDKGLNISDVFQQTFEGTRSPKKSPRLKGKASEFKEDKAADKRVLNISDVVPETYHNTRSLKRSPCSKQKLCESKGAEVVDDKKELNISDIVPENCHNTRSKTKSPCWKQKVFDIKDATAGDKMAFCVSDLTTPDHCGKVHPFKEESSTSTTSRTCLQTIVSEKLDDKDSSSYSRERSTSDSHKHTKSHKKGAPDKKRNRQNIITTPSTPTSSFSHTSSKKNKKKSEKKSPSRTLNFKSSSSTHPAPSSPNKSPRVPSPSGSTHPAPSTPSKSPQVPQTPTPTVSSKSPSLLKKSHKKSSESPKKKHQPETIFTPSEKPKSRVTQSKTSSSPAASTTIQTTTTTTVASKKAPTTKTKKKHKVAAGHPKSSMFSPKEPEIKLKYVNYREEKRDSGRADPTFSPFVHVEVKGHTTCTVINYPEEDTVSGRKRNHHHPHQQQQSSSSYITGAVPSSPSLTYGRVSMAAARRAALVCCLCGRSANTLDLGDLHGPYYAEGYKADRKAAAGGSRSSSGGGRNGDPELVGGDVGVGMEEEEDVSDSDSSFGTRNRKFPSSGGTPGSWSRRAWQWRPSDQPGGSSLVTHAGGCWAVGDDDSGSGISGIEPLHSPMAQHYSPAAKRARMDTSACSMESWLTAPVLPLDPHEYWLHEDCGIWSAGVFLVKGKLYGLERAVKMAQETVCSTCHKLGATLGCFFRECSNKYHYICAIQSHCVLNEENFSMKCIKHKNKSIKGSTNRKTAR